MWIYILLIWIVCAGFSAFIASQKNRSAGNWFILGLFFGLFALIAIAAVPVIANKPTDYNGPAFSGSGLQSWECQKCHQLNGFAINECSKCGNKRY